MRFCPLSFPCSRSVLAAARRRSLSSPPATSGYRPEAATPSPPSPLLGQPSVLGVALPSAASTPQYLGTRQTSDRDRIARQGLSRLGDHDVLDDPSRMPKSVT